MHPTLNPNLGNTLIDRVIDAAEAAGFGVPAEIKALHSDDDSRKPNRWHQAMALGSSSVDERQQALDELTQAAEWAQKLRERPSVKMAIGVQQAEHQSQKMAAPSAAEKLLSVMSIDDALQLPVIAQIYQEPVVAQRALRKALRDETDLKAVINQLETTPQHYGKLVGDRVDGRDLPARELAMTTLRDQLIAPLAAVAQADDKLASVVPSALKPRAAINHKVLAFDEAARRLVLTQKAMMATDITREIAHERDMSQGVNRGPYKVQRRGMQP